MQTSIFDMLFPKYKITKPIRLIELFAGYGSQYLALKYLGTNVKHYKICEWAIKSIQAYNDLHIQDYFDYSGDLSDDNILNVLVKLGVSINYNEPATKEQLKRQNFRKAYNNIIATNNLVNIQNVKGEDFKIVDKNQYEYIMTYSFPCQDLSLAGKGKGMADTSTRSGMLWEVERILNELKETNSLPQILLMENVPQVHGTGNVQHFNKWQLALEKLGYKNYFQDLIATNYGIPQTRNRCFMVSILGDYSYTFPKPIPLTLKLKDMLEDEVDEKYYLSDKFISCMVKENVGGYPRAKRFEQSITRVNKQQISNTITTLEGNRDISTFICIKNNTKKGYLKATDGDGIDISSRMEHHRGNVQKNKIQTLTTSGGNDRGVCLKNLSIRKLTPLECFRLMGVKDEDYYKITKNQSNSSLYHLVGDSICTSCLMALFSQLLDISWEDKLWNIKNSTKKEIITYEKGNNCK